MTRERSKDLVNLTDLMLGMQTARFGELLAHESRLRNDLARLEEHHRSNINRAASELHDLCLIGGDLLWLSWIGRQKAGIQRELAQVLSQKTEMLRHLKRAFGKHEAAKHLFAEDQCKHHRFVRSRREAELAEFMTLREIGKSG